VAYGESNCHVIKIQNAGLAEVCTVWVHFLVTFIIVLYCCHDMLKRDFQYTPPSRLYVAVKVDSKLGQNDVTLAPDST